MASNGYVFHKTKDNDYVRKCFGLEAFGSVCELVVDSDSFPSHRPQVLQGAVRWSNSCNSYSGGIHSFRVDVGHA